MVLYKNNTVKIVSTEFWDPNLNSLPWRITILFREFYPKNSHGPIIFNLLLVNTESWIIRTNTLLKNIEKETGLSFTRTGSTAYGSGMNRCRLIDIKPNEETIFQLKLIGIITDK